MKVGKILGCLNFGSADSPRVRGGQSAVHGTCSPEKFSIAKIHCGRSACVGQYLPEAVSVERQCENSKADGPLGYRGQSANGQKGGVGQT